MPELKDFDHAKVEERIEAYIAQSEAPCAVGMLKFIGLAPEVEAKLLPRAVDMDMYRSPGLSLRELVYRTLHSSSS